MFGFDMQLDTGNYSVVNAGGHYVVRENDNIRAILERRLKWEQTGGAPLEIAVFERLVGKIEDLKLMRGV
jgi:hypothetical protein